MKVVKRVIVGVLVAALAAGGIYTGLMHVKESKVTEVPVTSVSNLQTDWYSETTLDGTITTNVSQNVNMDKDMIIEKIYVSQGDDVKKGDNLISFDMTLVEMELNIAKLKQQKQEQDLTKAQNRLTSLQNGGPIEDSTDSTDDTDLNLTGGDTGNDGEMTNTETRICSQLPVPRLLQMAAILQRLPPGHYFSVPLQIQKEILKILQRKLPKKCRPEKRRTVKQSR